ncbi:MAG: 2-iminoacetate synthase ThiH [Marinifilaceae bacterium]
MSFYDFKQQYKWEDVKDGIFGTTQNDVLRALGNPKRNVEDFMALISPAATPFLEQMAVEANRLTLSRFGNVMQMYIPLYVSNYCQNACVYCGFSHKNKIGRKMLNLEDIDREVEAILKLGYKHILLVSGEAPAKTNAEYYKQVIDRIRPHFSQIALEVQPLETDEYALLHDAGLGFVCIYQETYNEERYPFYHPAGKKADYRYRLETPDRVGMANVQKIGIGALLGLEDWRTDSFYTALHLKYLERTYWRTKYSISLPRLRPHVGGFMPNDPINDREMVQLICAYRLLSPEAEISLSTRESAAFRDNVMPLGVTSVSAGSSTEPGGYAEQHRELEQFSINDSRSPQEMAAAIRQLGYEPVWKDWDSWM